MEAVPGGRTVSDRNQDGPSWKHRRRFFYFTVAFAALLTVYVAVRWDDLDIAAELITLAGSLWLGVLGFYTTGAVYEDVKLWRHTRPTGDEGHPDEPIA